MEDWQLKHVNRGLPEYEEACYYARSDWSNESAWKHEDNVRMSMNQFN